MAIKYCYRVQEAVNLLGGSITRIYRGFTEYRAQAEVTWICIIPIEDGYDAWALEDPVAGLQELQRYCREEGLMDEYALLPSDFKVFRLHKG